MQKYEALLDKLKIFEKMYDVMRIVDPFEKRVIQVSEDKFIKSDIVCYNYWDRNQLCNNCISMRAYKENDTFFKMEYKEGNIFMITAVPIEFQGNCLVIELIKNTSKNMVFGEGNSDCDSKTLTMIEYMNQVAIKDSLTGLYNRRYIDERLPAELLDASLKGEPLSVIFADIDFFKKINDTYGHSTGDLVLKEFAKELERFIRKDGDWVARFGGEEFLICLPGTDLYSAKGLAENIRDRIEKKEFEVNGETINLTCSFGVHVVCEDNECKTVDGVIKLVDEHLYKAKNLGRNRVE